MVSLGDFSGRGGFSRGGHLRPPAEDELPSGATITFTHLVRAKSLRSGQLMVNKNSVLFQKGFSVCKENPLLGSVL